MTLKKVQEKIHAAATIAGRSPTSVRLLAVSKTKSATDVEAVYAQGQRDFGENYVDELIQKAQALTHLKDIHWVFIGQLQSNKIQKLIEVCDEIQTVASEKHARYVDRYAGELGKKSFPVWIHVNADHEDQKFGVSPEIATRLAEFIQQNCPNLDLQGIMTIPPASYNDQDYQNETPPLYRDLASLAVRTGRGKLSLGMTNDLNLAIAAGSDCVRVGTAIFGART